MNIRHIILFLLTFSVGCTRPIDEKPIFDLFEINYNVTEKGLTDNGYAIIPEDVPLFGKQISDTLIYYQLNYECDSLTKKCINTYVSYRFCFIHLNRVDTLILNQLISKYDADIISDIFHSNEMNVDGMDLDSASPASKGFHGTFFVMHRFTRQIFQCTLGPAKGTINGKKDGFELSIQNEFPWTEKQIRNNRWIFGSKAE